MSALDPVVTLTLNLTLSGDQDTLNELNIVAERALRAAVNAAGNERNARGTGFDYSYEKKKSRRGLCFEARKQ